MDFRTKSYLTLTKQKEGILGAEMYILPQGLAAYGHVVHDANYYLAGADKDNWRVCAREILGYVPEGTPAMEYGTGDAETAQKAGDVVKALNSSRYTGVDLSKISLEQALRTISSLKQGIETIGLETDFWAKDFPVSDKPTLALFAGGAIENFEVAILNEPPRHQLTSALSTLADRTNGGWILVSADMWLPNHSANYYEKAYSGPDHSIFNLSVFQRMKEELDLDIDPEGFSYCPSFNAASGAVQHMAYANKSQSFCFDSEQIRIKEGDAFLLQNSFRFTEKLFSTCVADAELVTEKVWTHPVSTMHLHLLRRDNIKVLSNTAKTAQQLTA